MSNCESCPVYIALQETQREIVTSNIRQQMDQLGDSGDGARRKAMDKSLSSMLGANSTIAKFALAAESGECKGRRRFAQPAENLRSNLIVEKIFADIVDLGELACQNPYTSDLKSFKG